MPSSFFTGTEAELYSGTKNFATIISTDFASYGITSAQATNYQTVSDNFVAAYDALKVPSTRTKAATAAKNTAKIFLKLAISDLSRIIEGQSTVTDEQKVLLGLNVRKTPGPVDAPGTPTDFSATLRTDGALLLKWKCVNPANAVGVIYQLYRVVDGGELTSGGAGKRMFIDSTVPMGTSTVTYTIQATRTTTVGVAADFLVKFGADSSGTTSVEVVANKTKSATVAA